MKKTIEEIEFLLSYLRYLVQRGERSSAMWAAIMLSLCSSLDALRPSWRIALITAIDAEGINVRAPSLSLRSVAALDADQLLLRLIAILSSSDFGLGETSVDARWPSAKQSDPNPQEPNNS